MKAAYELGLALHYVSDMTQPMHSSSFAATQIPLSLHPVFEDYVPSVQGRFPARGAWDGRYRKDNADQAFVELARKGRSRGISTLR